MGSNRCLSSHGGWGGYTCEKGAKYCTGAYKAAMLKCCKRTCNVGNCAGGSSSSGGGCRDKGTSCLTSKSSAWRGYKCNGRAKRYCRCANRWGGHVRECCQ